MEKNAVLKTDIYTLRYQKAEHILKIATVIASVIVFFTTYVWIIPSVTWNNMLICELTEHTHTARCYTNGELTCGKTEHTHTEACFDAPPARENDPKKEDDRSDDW